MTPEERKVSKYKGPKCTHVSSSLGNCLDSLAIVALCLAALLFVYFLMRRPL